MLKVAVIGYGGISKNAHIPAYMELEKEKKAEIVAVCDINKESFDGGKKINLGSVRSELSEKIKKYTDYREMIEKENIDMVDICVPTYLHEKISVDVLKKGINVLCEKPMSLNYGLCENMCDEAKKSGKMLMIAQCCRFNEVYLYVKKILKEGTYGKIKSAVFKRLSNPPLWGWENWFEDYEKSGGCILDMHIHDIDLMRYILGDPYKVSCFTYDFYSKKDIVHSRLCYDDFSVLVIGDWSREGVEEFVSEFDIALEKATVISDKDGLRVYPRGGEMFKPLIEDKDMYKAEIEYFIDCIENKKENILNNPMDSANTVKLIEKLIESSSKGGEFVNI